MAGLGHDGALGHAGAQPSTPNESLVAGDARFRDQLFDDQGYGLGCQAGWLYRGTKHIQPKTSVKDWPRIPGPGPVACG